MDTFAEELAGLQDIIDETGWTIEDDTVIYTCCGWPVEWDCPRCPECGNRNPIVNLGIL